MKKIPWNKGLTGSSHKMGGTPKGTKFSKEHKRKLSERKKELFKDETKHPHWKDKKAYSQLHKWVKKHLGSPKRCESCGKIKKTNYQIHWANKSGKYKLDLTDWIRLCAKCHHARDRGIKLPCKCGNKHMAKGLCQKCYDQKRWLIIIKPNKQKMKNLNNNTPRQPDEDQNQVDEADKRSAHEEPMRS